MVCSNRLDKVNETLRKLFMLLSLIGITPKEKRKEKKGG